MIDYLSIKILSSGFLLSSDIRENIFHFSLLSSVPVFKENQNFILSLVPQTIEAAKNQNKRIPTKIYNA